MPGPNPNGYGGWGRKVNPKQALCWAFYTDPDSETFGNAAASARKAGFAEATADSVTRDPWFMEYVQRSELFETAEKTLKKIMRYDSDRNGELDNTLLKTQADTAKFLAERLGKTYYAAQAALDVTSGGKALTKEDTANLLATLGCADKQDHD